MPLPKCRHTLAKPFQCTGITIHSGIQATVTVSPNPHGTGILFGTMPASYKCVVHTRNATCISDGTTTISTVEHLLSALYACGIDDAVIQCTQPELPIMDGGSADFVDAVHTAGRVATEHKLSYVKITDTITCEGDKGAYVAFSPYDGFYIDAGIDFAHPAIGCQRFQGDINPDVYGVEIAPARTFGFMDQLLHYQKYDLARGASIDTAVVFGDDAPLNPLRFADEPVRHKVLDIIGDMALCGYPIVGKITARNMGHRLNNQAVYTLFADSNAYSIINT